jgi:hypothetical protein
LDRIFAAALVLVTPESAAAMDLSLNGRYVTISGTVAPQEARHFLDAVQVRREPTTVVLDSNGGYLREAAWISQIIRIRGWEIMVPNRAICNSACPLIWLGGVNRSLDSRLGFHSAAKAPVGSGIRHEEANAFIAGFMRQMGAPEFLIALQPIADPCCFNYVNHDKAEALGPLGPQPTTVKTELEIQAWFVGLRILMERQRGSLLAN